MLLSYLLKRTSQKIILVSLFHVQLSSDINECNDTSNMCSEYASCINLMGSFECQCYEGYAGDGFHCIGTINLL